MTPKQTVRPHGGEAMRTDAVARLRQVCLALPEATEREAWGDPTFRVRDKIFATQKRGDGRVSVWCKAPPAGRDALVDADPDRFFVPPYVGHHGWIGIRLDGAVDWGEVADLVRESYRLIAPKRLSTRRDHTRRDHTRRDQDR